MIDTKVREYTGEVAKELFGTVELGLAAVRTLRESKSDERIRDQGYDKNLNMPDEPTLENTDVDELYRAKEYKA